MADKKRGLGKGLNALFAENITEDGNSVVTLRLSEIMPNKEQPRKAFDEDALADLATSISKHGVLQPLIVRPLSDGSYQLIAGERRFRASHIAGLSEVPVVVKNLSDREASEVALIENLQREDLNPMEEALGYQRLMEDFELTQEETSKAVGKSRSAVANSLRLLTLPEIIAEQVAGGRLSAGHARTLLSIEDAQFQLELAEKIVADGLSVREVEKISKSARSGSLKKSKNVAKPARDSFFDEVELALTEHLGRKVTVNLSGSQKSGSLQIEFYSPDDLKIFANDICDENEN